MTNIEWGEPIAVDGKRPEWLAEDSQRVSGRDKGIAIDWTLPARGVDWRTVGTIRLPADHPYYATAATPAKPLCPDTVRACLGVVANASTLWNAGSALEALLPKPDPAKVLVEEWAKDRGDVSYDERNTIHHATKLAFDWLIDTGRIVG